MNPLKKSLKISIKKNADGNFERIRKAFIEGIPVEILGDISIRILEKILPFIISISEVFIGGIPESLKALLEELLKHF